MVSGRRARYSSWLCGCVLHAARPRTGRTSRTRNRRMDTSCRANRQEAPFVPSHVVGELVEAALLQVVVEAPALDLHHHLVELAARHRLEDEALAARELRVVPLVGVLEVGRDAFLPERQVFLQVGLEG